MFCVRRFLHSQLVIQIQLRRMHGFGGLFGLTGQFVELCHRIIGGISLHICRENAPEDRNTG